MNDAVALFQKIMAENNLTAALSKPTVKYIENGGVIIEQPQLLVSFVPGTQPVATPEPEAPKEEVTPETGKVEEPKDEPKQPTTNA